MSNPKVAVIEEPAAETIARLRRQLQEVEEERDSYREALDRNLPRQDAILAGLEEARQRFGAIKVECERLIAARDEALRQATALHQSLVTATAERAEAHAEGVRHAARAIEARAVAAWLLQEWTDPANWGEAIAGAEAKFGMLDWLREGKT